MFLNINIQDDVHTELKIFAAKKKTTMVKIVEKAVVAYMANSEIKDKESLV